MRYPLEECLPAQRSHPEELIGNIPQPTISSVHFWSSQSDRFWYMS